MKTFTVRRKIHFATGDRGRNHVRPGEKRVQEATQEIPRIARLMALAIHFDDLIRQGKVKDYAELARLGQVSRARITQIMGLLNLAPVVQDQLLSTGTLRSMRRLSIPKKTIKWQEQLSLLRETADAKL